jgi:hypothetical protein
MYKTHKYTLLLCLVLPSMSLLHGCATSTKSTVTASPQGTSLSSTKIVDSGTGSDRSISSSDTPDSGSGQIGGSKTPSEWVYSKDRAVACRINKWASYSMETDVDFEFANLKSEKPVNIVYTVVPKLKSGRTASFFNFYTYNQSNLTEFDSPLKRGQVKVENYRIKNVLPSISMKLSRCRVAKKNESDLTVNPEMENYVGP